MEEKILDTTKKVTLKQVIDSINKMVNKKFQIVEKNDDMEKWTSLPVLLLESEEIQQRILQFIEYIDELFLSKEEKVAHIITLSSLMKTKKLDIKEMDDSSLFVLIDYFKDKNISDFEKELIIVNQPAIIKAVRNKTLENEYRIKLLHYIVKVYQSQTIENSNQLASFIQDTVNMIETLDYYELLKKIEE